MHALFCHMSSKITILETASDRGQTFFPATAAAVKKHFDDLSQGVYTLHIQYFKSMLFEIWLQLITVRNGFGIRSSPDLSYRSGSGLQD